VLKALFTLAAVAAAAQSLALGFGRSAPAAVLGQPLDFSVALRVEPGDAIASDCVAAEVTVGDALLPSYAVGALLETTGGTPQVRVRTQAPVDEPVVSVVVSVGCGAKVSRRFTLFADPPAMGPATAPAALALAPAPIPAAPTTPPAPSVPPPTAPAPGAPAAPASPGTATAARSATREPMTEPSARPSEQAEAPRKPRRRVAAAGSRPRPSAAAEKPRLTLDAPSISVPAAAAAAAAASAAEQQAALQAAQAAASAAQAAASAAASAAEARVAALEKQLRQLQKDSQASRETIAQLSRTLAEKDASGQWLPWLAAAVAALLAAVAWLGWRLRQAQRTRHDSAWWAEHALPAEAAGLDEPEPAVSRSTPRLAAAAGSASVVFDDAADAAPGAHDGRALLQRTAPLPAGLAAPGAPARDVSIEELIDLEQQAEFFIVLGQDEAAIDLLVSHLRSTGGTVPLPYLKLLEIYRRLGDEAAYERTRERFNQRFNSVAPPWGTDLNDGRALEDYPAVMAQVERAWASPVDAMAILETLLSRTDAGALFDLPAYREVLFLYALARDLLDRDTDQPLTHVDVLLPLEDGRAFAATSPRPFFADAADADADVEVDAGLDFARVGTPTAPVDLDLTAPDALRPISQFGLLEPFPPLAPLDKRPS
jgi:hypothetical protein